MVQEEVAQDEPLQAVVLCDVFNQRLSPLTLDTPRCLMPVCNVPLLEWTLESLATANVQEVFLLATWHAPAIRAYLERHHAVLCKAGRAGHSSASSLTRVTVIPVPEARSVGDAMRELDSQQVIKSDFVLIHADAVGSLDLAAIVQAHKQRRRVDWSAIMTICTMPTTQCSRARRLGDLSVFTLAPPTSQLLHYTSVPAVPRKTLLKLPLELLDEPGAQLSTGGRGAELDVRNDLVDCGVDICSIDVPPLFTENFDYQSLRREFVQGILTSDLLEAKIYVHVAAPAHSSSTSSGEPWSALSGGVLGVPSYGAGFMHRASDPAGYDAVSRDVIAGWMYPYSLLLGLPGGAAAYTGLKGGCYVGEGASYAKSARLGRRSILGAGSRLDDAAGVEHSVLGARVCVGAHSHIQDAYLWDDVSVGRSCRVAGCILGHGVRILDNVHLAPGTLVSGGCVIGPGVRLARNSRVSLHRFRTSEDEDEDDLDVETPTLPDASLGEHARGHLWPPLGEGTRGTRGNVSDDDSADELDELEHPLNARLFAMHADVAGVELSDAPSEISSIDADSDPDLVSESDENDVDSDSDMSSPLSHSVYGSVSLTLPGGEDSQTHGEKMESEQRLSEFRAEATASLDRAFEESHAPENAGIELKTLRMASNVPTSEVRRVAISFILGRCSVEHARETAALLDHWGPLISDVARDGPVEALAVMQVYNDEIVSDDAILAWWRHRSSRDLAFGAEDAPASAQQLVLELRKRAEPVLRHILESQEESEEGEEEESDGGEGEGGEEAGKGEADQADEDV
ncbi:translation initiation factor eIF-2B epsilon subunit, GEF [Malassezia sp. CBS 17886]|nr:translation initiation factor eIF-2B epsilon subunit, GEF [Malassezia sp. CBS 17886]